MPRDRFFGPPRPYAKDLYDTYGHLPAGEREALERAYQHR